MAVTVGSSRWRASSTAAKTVASDSGRSKRSPIRSALRWQHVVLGQMYPSRFHARAVLHRGIHAFGKLAPVPLAASTTGLQNPVFGNLVMRGRQIEDLAGFNPRRFQQQRTALIADRRRCVGNDVVRTLGLLEGMPLMPLLASWRVWGRGAERLRLGFAINLPGGRAAGVAAVLCQTPFQFGNLRRQLLNSRKQRSDQIVFLGNAESVKVRQGFHARLYRITQPFLIAGKAIFFLAT